MLDLGLCAYWSGRIKLKGNATATKNDIIPLGDNVTELVLSIETYC